jgi:hypothetical protein
MIPVANPIPEPPDFDAVCRAPGIAWRAARRLRGEPPKASEFPNLWAKYEADLSRAFKGRCGWWAMWIAEGEVEHYLSKKNRPDLIYEWSNYRYIAGSVNGSKGNHDDKVLDPFEVQDGWFEVILPSMQLIVTDHLPAALTDKACFTLKQLRLRDGTKVVRCRRRWYESFKNGMPLSELEKFAPLVAKAVKKLQNSGETLP